MPVTRKGVGPWPSLNTAELEVKVREMYRHVAQQPQGAYHFEMGRPVAERLGYPADMLDRLPAGAVESFAGVGYFFDLADLAEGERGDRPRQRLRDGRIRRRPAGRAVRSGARRRLHRRAARQGPPVAADWGSTRSSSLKGGSRACRRRTRASTA